ncbi:hypothetical protein [Haliangium ochraceum]|uniref:Uncharacterized protein n=1 Tax=Haliangium ochraceum (strain DSM 14365 / JCM 11303 / SMP-2) TaxID=502025 RepID=D0LL13_HALO1|nr:hypothetical protein [Haliangium ochraceum]ACY16733.1 hypothetical protein Hoch_4236 [Haliangium ochraceum DSM 14365]
MLFAEEQARWLLVLHTGLATALVAASTHLVIWLLPAVRGTPRRVRAVRKFAWISAALYVATLVIGNMIYPVYKVRVRGAYLEQPAAVIDAYERHVAANREVLADHRALTGDAAGGEVPASPPPSEQALRIEAEDIPHQTVKIARWFDVKEHWVALGAALALGCAFILTRWDPHRHARAITRLVFLLALGAAGAAWLGAIIGVVVSSYRAVGGPG